MKRQRINDREKAEAEEKAQLHRSELLADLQARGAAWRQAGEPPVATSAPATESTPAPENDEHSP